MKIKSWKPVGNALTSLRRTNSEDDAAAANKTIEDECGARNDDQQTSDSDNNNNNDSNNQRSSSDLRYSVQRWMSSFYRSDPRCQVHRFYESTALLLEQQQQQQQQKPPSDATKNNNNAATPKGNSSRSFRHPSLRRSPKASSRTAAAAATTATSSDDDEDIAVDKTADTTVASTTTTALSHNETTDQSSHPAIFTVWRPTSRDAIRLMISGQAVGKGLEIKGKSAKKGILSGFVPFLQIDKDEHKQQIRTLPRDGRTQVFVQSEDQRSAIIEALQPYQEEMKEGAHKARQIVLPNRLQSAYQSMKRTGQNLQKKKEAAVTSLRGKVSSVRRSLSHSFSDHSHDSSELSALAKHAESEGQVENASSEEGSPTKAEAESATSPDSKSSTIQSTTSKSSKVHRRKLFHKKKSSTQPQAIEDNSSELLGPESEHLEMDATTEEGSTSLTTPDAEASESSSKSHHHHHHQHKFLQKMKSSAKELKQRAVETKEAVKNRMKERQTAVHRLLFWEMEDYSVKLIDTYSSSNPPLYGLELSDRLLWNAFVQDADISRPPGSPYETGRPSQPAFMDMNWHSIYQTRHHQTKMPPSPKKLIKQSKMSSSSGSGAGHKLSSIKQQLQQQRAQPRVVLVQSCQENPMDPRGLIMAYEEEGRVRPVVSDFDCFTMGTRDCDAYHCPLPPKQVELVEWCLSNIQHVLELQASDPLVNWTTRWLDVLKQHAAQGFHPEIPRFGFGDQCSYGIVEDAVASLKQTGAVRHGAESFNYYFPQDLDEEFLIVYHDIQCISSSRSNNNNVPWRYVNVVELQEFLMERATEGFTFPLNPKWILCDKNWKPLYDRLMASPRKDVQDSLNVWYPTHVRDQIESIHAQYPQGFVYEKSKDDDARKSMVVDGTAAMDLATLELEQFLTLRRAKTKMICFAAFVELWQSVRHDKEDKKEEEDNNDEET